MIAALPAGLVAGYALALPMGPVGTYLVSLSARTSLRSGAAGALGVASVDGGYALVAVLGSRGAAEALRPVLPVLRWVAAAVLLVLGARTVVGAYRSRVVPAAANGPQDARPWRTYAHLVGLTAINPATVIYFVALVVGLRHHSGFEVAPLAEAVFVLAVFAASASWQLFLAAGGALLGRRLTGTRARHLTGLASGLIISALAVRLAVS